MHLYINNFSIRIFELPIDAPFFTMENGRTVLDIKSDKTLLNPNAAVILADPFLFVKDGTLFLFYEHLDKWFGKGRLCMRSTKDMVSWSEEVDILVEPFHLSFPYVFEENGKVYMLPETGGDNSIRLYVAEDDTLTKWKLIKKLKDGGEPWYDSLIFKRDDTYFLFTGHDDNKQQVQHLFLSNELLGPYTEHTKSPIYIGRDGGRNAGSIIEHNGNLYRPVQVCIDGYGEQTSIMGINKLSPKEYQEDLYKKDIINTEMKPYKLGGHQWNEVIFMGKRVIATDYREKNYNIIEFFRRIKNFISR